MSRDTTILTEASVDADVPDWLRKCVVNASYNGGLILRGAPGPVRVVRLVGWALDQATVVDRWSAKVLGSVSWPNAVSAYEHGELDASEIGPYVDARYGDRAASTPTGEQRHG